MTQLRKPERPHYRRYYEGEYTKGMPHPFGWKGVGIAVVVFVVVGLVYVWAGVMQP